MDSRPVEFDLSCRGSASQGCRPRFCPAGPKGHDRARRRDRRRDRGRRQADDRGARHADTCRAARQALDSDRRHRAGQCRCRSRRAGDRPSRRGQAGAGDHAGAGRRSRARRGRARRPLSDPPARRHPDGCRRPGARQSNRHADAQFRRWQGGAAGRRHRRTDHRDHLRRRRRAPRCHHLRGHRRPAQGGGPRPRDHRTAAQIPRSLRPSRHRCTQGRSALRPARAPARR